MTGGKFQSIYAFELDYQNYSRLATKHQNVDIKLFNMGLYSEDRTVSFSSGNGGSSVIEEGRIEKIKVCNFDRLVGASKDVSLFKM